MVTLLAAGLLAATADGAQAATPVFHGTTSKQGTGTRLSIPPIATARSGDALVVAVAYAGQADLIAPAGWRRIRSDASPVTGSGRLTLFTFVRRAGTAPTGGMWRFSRSVAAVGLMVAYGGVANAARIPGNAGSLRRGGAGTFAPPSVRAKRDAVVLGVFAADMALALAPGRVVRRGRVRSIRPGVGLSLEVSERVAASTGGHAPGAASTAGTALIGETLVLDPAPPAPGVTVTSAPPPVSNSSSATFSFAAGGPADGFVCSLDGQPARACRSPVTFAGLQDGSHSFGVAATAAGRSGAAATRSWTVDTVGPTVAITSAFPPNNSITGESRATFALSSPEVGVALQCRLNALQFAGCVSPISYGPFDAGTYVFQARGVDAAGNVGDAVTSTWIIGGGGGGGGGGGNTPLPPTVSITSSPSASESSTTATFTFAASSPGASLSCSLDGAAFSACASPLSLPGLAQGAHIFRVRAADGGLTGSDDTRAWTVDSVAPATPTGLSTLPAGPADDNAPELTGTAEPGATITVYTGADCSGMAIASGSAASFATTGITAAVADNTTTTFSARATDATGNVSACSNTINYSEDSTTAAPSGLALSPANPANDNMPELTGTAETGATVSIYANGTCTAPTAASGSTATFASPGLTVTVADNTTTTFSARATDAAGNVSACSNTIIYTESSPGGPVLGTSLYPAVPDSPGAIHYVSMTGDDTHTAFAAQNPLTPWRTIQHAIDTVADGSVIEVRAGTYNEELDVTNGGTVAAPVTVRNFPNESPVLHPEQEPPGSFTAIPSALGGTLAASRYRYFVSATVPVLGVTPTARQIVDTTGATGSVALTWSAVSGATAYTVYRTVAGATNAADAATPTGQARPIATLGAATFAFVDTGAVTPSGGNIADHYPLTIDGADYFRFQGFVIENASGVSTANVYITGLSDHVELSDNEIRNSQRQGIFVDPTVTNLHIDRNWVHDNGGNARTRDHGIYIEGVGHQIADNVIADHRYGFGIQVFPAADNFIIASNTIVGNAPTTNEAGIILGGDCSVGAACRADNNLVVNNILAANVGPGIKAFWTGGNIGTNNRVENNVGFGNGGSGNFPTNADGTGLVYGSGATANTVAAASPFVNLALRNLILAAGANVAVDTAAPAFSPLVDRLKVPRTNGAGPDIGALER